MEKKFLYFDTETTDAQIKDIIQLAFITDGDVQLNQYFKPKQDITFPAMAIHHITPEFVMDKPQFEDTSLPKENIDTDYKGDGFIEYLKFLSEKYIWVAHNAQFDAEVLARQGIYLPNLICTYKLSRNIFSNDGYDLDSYSLQYLRYYLGLYKKENTDHNTAHDAYSDVHFLKDLFHHIQDSSSLTVENMLTISKDPAVMRSFNFGKYFGKTLEDVARMDPEYIQWLLRESRDEDLKYNLQRIVG